GRAVRRSPRHPPREPPPPPPMPPRRRPRRPARPGQPRPLGGRPRPRPPAGPPWGRGRRRAGGRRPPHLPHPGPLPLPPAARHPRTTAATALRAGHTARRTSLRVQHLHAVDERPFRLQTVGTPVELLEPAVGVVLAVLGMAGHFHHDGVLDHVAAVVGAERD